MQGIIPSQSSTPSFAISSPTLAATAGSVPTSPRSILKKRVLTQDLSYDEDHIVYAPQQKHVNWSEQLDVLIIRSHKRAIELLNNCDSSGQPFVVPDFDERANLERILKPLAKNVGVDTDRKNWLEYFLRQQRGTQFRPGAHNATGSLSSSSGPRRRRQSRRTSV